MDSGACGPRTQNAQPLVEEDKKLLPDCVIVRRLNMGETNVWEELARREYVLTMAVQVSYLQSKPRPI